MTASKYIKDQGLKDLQYVADKVGKHRDTINNWYHNNFPLFEAVVAGVSNGERNKRLRETLEEARAWIADAKLNAYVLIEIDEVLEEKIDD